MLEALKRRVPDEVKRLVPAGIKRRIQPWPPARPLARSMSDVLAQLGATTEIETVVDIGASNGQWTQEAQKHLSANRYLLIEAQAAPHEEALRAFCSADPRVQYIIAAAGSREGQIHFLADAPLGGVASEEPTGEMDIVVPVTTIDQQVSEKQLDGPYLIKLDTHGFEIPVLTGATKTLPRASALIIEAYNIKLRDGSPRFHELCAWLDARGFQSIDMCDLSWRPSDGALWQMDIVFVPASRSEFANAAYSA